MAFKELVRTKVELTKIADLMYDEAKKSGGNTVVRYLRSSLETKTFFNGQSSGGHQVDASVNKESMGGQVYNCASVDDLLPHNFNLIQVARDLQDYRFSFDSKGVELPKDTVVAVEEVPSEIDFFDSELREFTKSHEHSKFTRSLRVEQKIIANSQGGIAIQSLPYFTVAFNFGYSPISTHRSISAICNTGEDIKAFTRLIPYLADPTPDKRIRNSKTFSEAFNELHKISGLKYGNLQEAGLPMQHIYEVVMLTGVPVHEIFGHHFEEPIRHLNFGESGTFKFGQELQNKDLVLTDNPEQEIGGFRVLGFTNFDAYGRKREPRVHIKDGKVVGFLGSDYADSSDKFNQFLNLEKSSFVGNASQHTDSFFPQPRMSCTVLDGKTEDIDLEGKLLVVAYGGETDPHRKTYVVNASECYVVKNGEPKRVIPLQISGGINQALSELVLLNDWTYQTGMCGKPEPIYFNANAQNPCSQFTRNQLWKGEQVYPLPISPPHLKILVDR